LLNEPFNDRPLSHLVWFINDDDFFLPLLDTFLKFNPLANVHEDMLGSNSPILKAVYPSVTHNWKVYPNVVSRLLDYGCCVNFGRIKTTGYNPLMTLLICNQLNPAASGFMKTLDLMLNRVTLDLEFDFKAKDGLTAFDQVILT